jgi:hypothetical protein
VKETQDGVKFNDPKVNVIQINSDVFDFWSRLTLKRNEMLPLKRHSLFTH